MYQVARTSAVAVVPTRTQVGVGVHLHTAAQVTNLTDPLETSGDLSYTIPMDTNYTLPLECEHTYTLVCRVDTLYTFRDESTQELVDVIVINPKRME
jgi:hypothetical protein